MWPLELATRVGIGLIALDFISLIVVIILSTAAHVDFHGLATLGIIMVFLAGLVLTFMGVLGEYIGRIYDEAKGRPLYIVAEGPEEPFNPIRLDLPPDRKA
jgi:dolichol-phosphate mannosyltransferase